MNAVAVLLLGLAAMGAGYFVYARFVAQRVFQLDANFRTPSHELEDGVDYVPTNKYVLWGHHFTSVAGAAPIVGPAVAVIWGWVPAFLWVVLGTIFFAGIHDAGALWASVRHKGRSIGSITGDLVGNRARNLFMVVIFLVLLMVNAVFGVVIAKLLIGNPSSVVPVWGAIIVAVIIGQCIYRRKMNLMTVSIVGVTALYALIGIGPYVPLELPETVAGLPANAQWIILLFLYAGIASLLPVWVLLQPRDYINGLQLCVGLAVIYVSILIANPAIVAPAFNSSVPASAPPIVPLLFVTIACGAISGFHGLVSSGTTSKQIDKETDVRFVGYFGAVGEGCLALAAILATTAGFASIGEWQNLYTNFGQAGVNAFVDGGAALVGAGVGLPEETAATLLTVMAVLFAGTTMDTGIRLQRYIMQEWGEMYNIPQLKDVKLSTLVAVGTCLALAFGAGGLDGSGGMLIWPLFGTTNQLLGGLTLLVLTVILVRLGRPMWYTLLPMVFLLAMTLYALLVQLKDFYTKGDWFLMSMDLVILVAAVTVLLESIGVLREQFRLQRATSS
jgi:carbon starvation protein